MDFTEEAKKALVEQGRSLRHDDLPGYLEQLGLPAPANAEGSKKEKVVDSFSQVASENLISVIEKFLKNYCTNPIQRNQLQDLMWATENSPDIPKRQRYEIADVIGDHFYADHGERGFDRLLEDLWILEDPNDFLTFVAPDSNSLKHQIEQHIHRNPGDWNAHKLFEELGAYNAPSRRFLLFIEGLSSQEVRPDESEQRRFVHALEPALRDCGFQFAEIGMEEGYPAFKIVPLNSGGQGKPKNIIFASSVKPDLRLSDAISNDVEVLTHRDQVLVYDRAIPDSGLTWEDLQKWWQETASISDEKEAKNALYRRLVRCLPKESPPQQHFFRSYYRHFAAKIPNLPALIPEVWLYWDPKTIRERGKDALKNLRMDFLMLLPGHQRVVFEIDGIQHYADESGQADTKRYANLVAADRKMRMLGYEIYRFGGAELNQENAALKIVAPFFEDLFKKNRIAL